MQRGNIVGNTVAAAATLCGVVGMTFVSGQFLGAAPVPDSAAAAMATSVEPAAPAGPAASPSMRLTYTWTGNSDGNDYWNEQANWSAASAGYPDDSTDDALFDECGFYTYFDASRTIDDLTLSFGGPDGCYGYFDAGGTERTLTCDTVTIGGGHIDFIKMVGKAGIETN